MNNSHPRRVTPGINDVATLAPDFAKQFSKSSPLAPHEVTPQSNKTAVFNCTGHTWEARISTVFNGGSCKYCANLDVLTGFNDLETHRPDLLKFYSKENPKKASEVLATGAKKLKWQCPKCRGHWRSCARDMRAPGSECPYCNSRKLLSGTNDFETLCPSGASLWSFKNAQGANEVFPFSNNLYLFTCPKHGDWRSSPNRISNRSWCPQCSRNSFRSKGEIELANFLRLEYSVRESERKIVKGYEADIFLPDYTIAIEYNGNYWHSDQQLLKTKGLTALQYHTLKLKAFEEQGIKLLYVWEDDWRSKRSQVIKALPLAISGASPDKILTTLSKG